MSIIRVLPENVASRIAAGEVIERPASVVTELLDNSVDAGADRIVVTIEKGGKKRIKVADNGTGMSRDDLLLCVERHATSKINTASDLFSVKSLGFRGEAVPSIVAVARVEIKTRRSEDVVGHRLEIAGGRLVSIEEAGAPTGTTVDVKDLFFNIPARKKFLRAVRTEADHITDRFQRTALPFSAVAFKLDQEGRPTVHFPVSHTFVERISAVMGRRVTDSMVEAKEEKGDLSLRAYLASPEWTRSRGDRLLIYVNGRNIRDRMVTKAVMESYGQRLMKGRYPQAVILLDIEPSKVDVNVHPMKQEVRFYKGREVFDTIVSVLSRALGRHTHKFQLTSSCEIHATREENNTPFQISEPSLDYPPIHEGRVRPESRGDDNFYIPGKGIRIIGQLAHMYILCETSEGFLIVDQHAAHERILYENLIKSIEETRLESQSLLVPIEIELDVKETGIILEKMEALSRFGIELEHFGGNTFLLRSVPALMARARWESFLPELIPYLEERRLDGAKVLEKIMAVMACHTAVRSGDQMSLQEMEHLISQLQGMDLPSNCPHGRPVYRKYSFYEIDKMFKRVL